jgi:hypothetical protein
MVDILEGLPVPGVSSPPSAIPDWNVYIESHLEAVFEFAHYFLHSNAPLLIFMPESPTMRAEAQTYARTYEFKILKDWWGFNSLRLASPKDPSATVNISIHPFIFLFQFIAFSSYNFAPFCRLVIFGSSSLCMIGSRLRSSPFK